MQATVDGVFIAEGAKEDLIRIEGTWYFPPSTLAQNAFTESVWPYVCPWKGAARYYDVNTRTGRYRDARMVLSRPLFVGYRARGSRLHGLHGLRPGSGRRYLTRPLGKRKNRGSA